MGAEATRLPYVDEHSLVIAAGREPTWEALLRATEAMTSSATAPRYARLVGCADTAASGPRPLAEGSAFPAETRAEFPGLKGSAYRALVIGTRMHVLATRRVLTAVKRRAERRPQG